jgi:hypothetical protein
MAPARRPTKLKGMNKTLANHVAWRRKNIRHLYVGRLEAMSDRLRFIGRAPELGIDLALSIPFEQIERARLANGDGERVLGERGIVLELVGAEPVFLREFGEESAPMTLLRLLEQGSVSGPLEAAHG